ncbi:MAG: cation diffusion facilitator family transporter [Bacteroidales bacterium]|jgi:cobalt-zinc-cadmium efflux system protein
MPDNKNKNNYGNNGHSHIYHSNYGNKSIYYNPNLIISLIFNFSSSVVQIIIGVLSNSIALSLDAFKKLDYVISILINYSISKKNKREDNFETALKIKRLEIIIIFFKAILFIVLTSLFLVEAYRAIDTEGNIDVHKVIIFGSAGFLANLISILLLYKSSKKSQKLKHFFNNQTLGLFSSVIVVISGIFSFYYNNYVVDSIATFFIAVLIFRETFYSIKQAFFSAMNSVPEDISLSKIKFEIQAFPEVKHLLKIKAINFGDNDIQVFCHIELKSDMMLSETKKLRKKIKEVLSKNKVNSVTMQLIYDPEK